MRLNPPLRSSRVRTSHLDGMVAWAQTRQTNDFLEAINGPLQAFKRRVHGLTRIATIKTITFQIVGTLCLKCYSLKNGFPL